MKPHLIFLVGGLVLWVGVSTLIPEQYGTIEAVRIGVAMAGFVMFVVGIINSVKYIRAKKRAKAES